MFFAFTTGSSESLTVTLKEQVCTILFLSVISNVFVVVPTGNKLPFGNPEICFIFKPFPVHFNELAIILAPSVEESQPSRSTVVEAG